MRRVFYLFLTWRVFLFIILATAFAVLPLQPNFIGGGSVNYLQAPHFWAWGNFDGEHYLNIARNGYGNGEQAFFPLFPFLIKNISSVFGSTLYIYNLVGLFVSNMSFVLALWGLFKLVKLDHDNKYFTFFLILLLAFPTSFYFGSVYTESLFLALTVWSFYFARKKRWILACLLGSLATATRVLGIVLLPALFVEMWFIQKKHDLKDLIPLLLIPLGLIYYMYYSYFHFDDPLKFVHVLPSFGEQRQIVPIILPRVFYRYIFKIFPNINYDYFPVVFTTLLEFVTAALFLWLVVVSFLKTRLSYAVYALFTYLIPTLSGSFSSLPRYVLIIFPAFLVMADYLFKKKIVYRLAVIILFVLSLVVATALFTRGFWVS